MFTFVHSLKSRIKLKPKNLLYLPILIVVAIGMMNFTAAKKELIPAVSPPVLSGKITLSGAYALYPMAVKCGEQFKKLNPIVSTIDFRELNFECNAASRDVLSNIETVASRTSCMTFLISHVSHLCSRNKVDKISR